MRKAHAAARAVGELNPDCEGFWHHGDLEADLGEGFLRQFDVVLSCLDSAYARYVLNRRCLRAGVPWVDSGIATLDGQVQVFHPGEGGCYECGFGSAHYELALGRIANSCNAIAAEAKKEGRSPTTVMIASIVAGVQVQECLKLLDRPAWGGRTFIGRKFEFSGTGASVDVYRTPEREDCPAHDFGLDWDMAAPVPLTDASAHMMLPDFLSAASTALGQEVHLALDYEFATGYDCPQCGTPSRALVAVHKALGDRLRCVCGWMPAFQSDLSLMNRVSPDMARARFANVALSAFDIPLGGVVELHAPNRVVRHVVLAADTAQWNTFWQREGANQ
jgi:adenylyltransferase/sulfurtransferase